VKNWISAFAEMSGEVCHRGMRLTLLPKRNS
jgi:hypothetical protein